MGRNGSHSSGSGTGRDFPPVFSWDWDGKRFIFVGVGRERFENLLPCYPLVNSTDQWLDYSGVHVFLVSKRVCKTEKQEVELTVHGEL